MATDLTVGQVISASKDIEAKIQALAPGVEARVLDLLTQLEKAFPGTVIADRAGQVAVISQGVETAIVADAQAAAKLTKQFGIPLAIAGGIKLQGTGQLLSSALQTFDGLRSAMTQVQKVIAIVTPVVQCVIIIAGTVISFYPQVGLFGIGGGLTVSKLIGVLAQWLNVKYSRYPDAPRAELVKLP